MKQLLVILLCFTTSASATDLGLLNRFTVTILDKDLTPHGAGAVYNIRRVNHRYSMVEVVTVDHVLYSRNMVRFFDGAIHELKTVRVSNKKDLALLECLVPTSYAQQLSISQFSEQNISILEELVAQGNYDYVPALVLRFTVCFLPLAGGKKRSELIHFGIQGCAFHGLSGSPVVDSDTQVAGLIQGAWDIMSWSHRTMPSISLVIPAVEIQRFIGFHRTVSR